MSYPIILYDNLLTYATPTATDTATGYDVLSIRDYRAYTTWKAASAGLKYITVDAGAEAAVTLANTKLSLETGHAFADFTGVDLSAYVGKRITVTDSAGKALVGWIKAAGGGRTYGTELIDIGDFEGIEGILANWTPTDCSLGCIAGG